MSTILIRRSGLLILSLLMSVGSIATAGDMKRYVSKYHVIYTDLPKKEVYEAAARINAVAEQYHDMTKGLFSGTIRKRLPFYLYSRYSDYLASLNGRGAGSAGMYTGKDLRACTDSSMFRKAKVWHVIQHEGWHQFAHMVVARRKPLPIWLNEGLAEYFGESLWTGDNLISGVIDTGETWTEGNRRFTRQGRLQRVQDRLRVDQFRPWKEMILLTHEQWNMQLDPVNYDQVWAMTHFLVHGRDNKYRKAFNRYINYVADGKPNGPAWVKCFGRDIDSIDADCKAWWLSLDGEPTRDRYDQATVETLMSFLARAHEQRKRFETEEEFFAAARDGKLDIDVKDDPKIWLPPALLDDALKQAAEHDDWSLQKDRFKRPQLILKREDGTELRGRYRPQGRYRLPQIEVEITPAEDSTAAAS
jgi:hypothetical protein